MVSKATYLKALAKMRGRAGHVADRRRKAPLTKSYSKWAADPSRYDMRGVDTPRKRKGAAKKRPAKRGPKKAVAKKRTATKRKATPAQLAALAYGRSRKSAGASKSTKTKKAKKAAFSYDPEGPSRETQKKAFAEASKGVAAESRE